MRVNLHFSKRLTEIEEIYWNRFLQSSGYSIIYSFLSIFIFVEGFNLETIFTYFFFNYLFISILSPLPVFIADKVGYKHSNALYVPFTIIFFFLLYTLPVYDWPIYFISLFFALSNAFYWVPSHILFASDSVSGKRGHEAGVSRAVPYIAKLFAPLLGAFLIESFGFLIAFFASSIIISISLVPLFLSPDIKLQFKNNISDLLKTEPLFDKEFIATGFIYAAMMIWPLFVYLHHETYLFVGVVGFLGGFGSALFTYFIGELSDKFSKNKLMQTGGGITAILWLMPVFFMNDILASVLSFATGFFFILVDVPLISYTYEEATKCGPPQFLVYREIILNIGRAFSLLLALLFFDFAIVFFLAFLGALYFTLPKSLK